ncbi:MAG: S-methyl-5'-thioadenosine phosphorylase [Candidatus Omnitrophota bacterium]
MTEKRAVGKIGIIGGSGLDDPKILKDAGEVTVETLYGKPSSPLSVGRVEGVEVVILARHGRGHTIPPTQVNYRANIQALKEQGCTHILATTACGSLRQEIARGDFVVLDQFIDFTRFRKITFFEEFEPGVENAKHTPMADAFSEELRAKLIQSGTELGLRIHQKGTVVTIEGPRFSTRAESRMFRTWGADVINMSIAPEVVLANEAGVPYAAVAMSTDYDCWKTDEPPVDLPEILRVFEKNAENIKQLLLRTIPKI